MLQVTSAFVVGAGEGAVEQTNELSIFEMKIDKMNTETKERIIFFPLLKSELNAD